MGSANKNYSKSSLKINGYLNQYENFQILPATLQRKLQLRG